MLDEDYLGDHEDPDESDADWNLDPAEVPCPYCKEMISEEAEVCPHCKSYISKEDAPREDKPIWIWFGMGLLVIIFLIWAGQRFMIAG